MASFFGALFGGESAAYEASTVLAVNISRDGLKRAARAGLRVRRVYSLGGLGVMVTELTVPEGRDPAEIVKQITRQGGKGFMVNHYYELARAGTGEAGIDPGRELIGWPWPCRSCGRRISMGMVDGPVDAQATALAGRRLEQHFFFDPGAKTDAGHGSEIAALLIGSTKGYTGLLPGARLFAAAAFTGRPGSRERGTALAVVRALDWLVRQRVAVINASFTGPDNPLLRRAIRKIARKKIPVVAAVGNHGPDGAPLFPAAYEEVIAVTAVDRLQRPYSRANRGDYIDVAAPGVRVPVPCAGGDGRDLCYRSGTSYAAPYCTAVVAVVNGNTGKKRSINRVRKLLANSTLDLGAPGPDPVFGMGLVHCNTSCRQRLR